MATIFDTRTGLEYETTNERVFGECIWHAHPIMEKSELDKNPRAPVSIDELIGSRYTVPLFEILRTGPSTPFGTVMIDRIYQLSFLLASLGWVHSRSDDEGIRARITRPDLAAAIDLDQTLRNTINREVSSISLITSDGKGAGKYGPTAFCFTRTLGEMRNIVQSLKMNTSFKSAVFENAVTDDQRKMLGEFFTDTTIVRDSVRPRTIDCFGRTMPLPIGHVVSWIPLPLGALDNGRGDIKTVNGERCYAILRPEYDYDIGAGREDINGNDRDPINNWGVHAGRYLCCGLDTSSPGCLIDTYTSGDPKPKRYKLGVTPDWFWTQMGVGNRNISKSWNAGRIERGTAFLQKEKYDKFDRRIRELFEELRRPILIAVRVVGSRGFNLVSPLQFYETLGHDACNNMIKLFTLVAEYNSFHCAGQESARLPQSPIEWIGHFERELFDIGLKLFPRMDRGYLDVSAKSVLRTVPTPNGSRLVFSPATTAALAQEVAVASAGRGVVAPPPDTGRGRGVLPPPVPRAGGAGAPPLSTLGRGGGAAPPATAPAPSGGLPTSIPPPTPAPSTGGGAGIITLFPNLRDRVQEAPLYSNTDPLTAVSIVPPYNQDIKSKMIEIIDKSENAAIGQTRGPELAAAVERVLVPRIALISKKSFTAVRDELARLLASPAEFPDNFAAETSLDLSLVAANDESTNLVLSYVLTQAGSFSRNIAEKIDSIGAISDPTSDRYIRPFDEMPDSYEYRMRGEINKAKADKAKADKAKADKAAPASVPDPGEEELPELELDDGDSSTTDLEAVPGRRTPPRAPLLTTQKATRKEDSSAFPSEVESSEVAADPRRSFDKLIQDIKNLSIANSIWKIFRDVISKDLPKIQSRLLLMDKDNLTDAITVSVRKGTKQVVLILQDPETFASVLDNIKTEIADADSVLSSRGRTLVNNLYDGYVSRDLDRNVLDYFSDILNILESEQNSREKSREVEDRTKLFVKGETPSGMGVLIRKRLEELKQTPVVRADDDSSFVPPPLVLVPDRVLSPVALLETGLATLNPPVDSVYLDFMKRIEEKKTAYLATMIGDATKKKGTENLNKAVRVAGYAALVERYNAIVKDGQFSVIRNINLTNPSAALGLSTLGNVADKFGVGGVIVDPGFLGRLVLTTERVQSPAGKVYEEALDSAKNSLPGKFATESLDLEGTYDQYLLDFVRVAEQRLNPSSVSVFDPKSPGPKGGSPSAPGSPGGVPLTGNRLEDLQAIKKLIDLPGYTLRAPQFIPIFLSKKPVWALVGLFADLEEPDTWQKDEIIPIPGEDHPYRFLFDRVGSAGKSIAEMGGMARGDQLVTSWEARDADIPISSPSLGHIYIPIPSISGLNPDVKNLLAAVKQLLLLVDAMIVWESTIPGDERNNKLKKIAGDLNVPFIAEASDAQNLGELFLNKFPSSPSSSPERTESSVGEITAAMDSEQAALTTYDANLPLGPAITEALMKKPETVRRLGTANVLSNVVKRLRGLAAASDDQFGLYVQRSKGGKTSYQFEAITRNLILPAIYGYQEALVVLGENKIRRSMPTEEQGREMAATMSNSDLAIIGYPVFDSIIPVDVQYHLGLLYHWRDYRTKPATKHVSVGRGLSVTDAGRGVRYMGGMTFPEQTAFLQEWAKLTNFILLVLTDNDVKDSDVQFAPIPADKMDFSPAASPIRYSPAVLAGFMESMFGPVDASVDDWSTWE